MPDDEPLRVYVGGGDPFELHVGDAVLCPVLWRFPGVELTLQLTVRVVDDRVVRLDAERRLRVGKRRHAYRVVRAAARAG